MPIQKVLIANRGEIACRIIQTCRRLQVATVAVYSSVDRYSRHVEMADESYYLGGADPVDSYLNIKKIIQVAKQAKVDAIHPGYGFLSERSLFAKAVDKAGMIFIGAPIKALEAMGSKSAAKHIMQEAGVPCVPGYHGDNQDINWLQEQADKIGYPLLIKAVSGGGGKGMKIVESSADFPEALSSARREAQKSFADDAVILEKYIQNPRHVEVQVFADSHGNVVHLFERDCSVQRRYQKIIEEAPANYLVDSIKTNLLNAAVDSAKAIDYLGAGTVEFILDDEENFYFMEMNTRLQVEHRVTELITKTDLVEWQIRVAEGKELPLGQMEIHEHGHAIEVRIYAEDPDNGFLPATGHIHSVHFHQEENTIVDSSIRQADSVSFYYDPMIAKIIAWDVNRAACIKKIQRILNQSYLFGIKSNMSFLSRILSTSEYQMNKIFTNTLDKGGLCLEQPMVEEVAAIVIDRFFRTSKHRDSGGFALDNWHLNLTKSPIRLEFFYQDEQYDFLVGADEPGLYQVNEYYYQLKISDYCYHFNKNLQVIYNNLRYEVDLPDPESQSIFHAGGNQLVAPMPGRVIAVNMEAGQAVSAGATVLVMEAMKMELSLKAETDTVIRSIQVNTGDQVVADQLLVEYEELK